MSFFGLVFKGMCAHGNLKRYAGYSFPEEIRIYAGISYGKGRWNTLNIYIKKNVKTVPVIINIHGGGYVYGNRSTDAIYCAAIAKRGFAVVNFSYHLAPRTKYPVQLEEINRVFMWVREHVEQYGGNPNQIFVTGDSAGAQMASQYLTVLTNPEYARHFPFAVPQISVRGAAFNCGMYGLTSDYVTVFKKIKEENGIDLNALLRDYLGKKPYGPELLNVPEYMTADFPPAYIMTGACDFLKIAAEPFAERLTRLGVKNICKCYGNTDDVRYRHVFHLNDSFDGAVLCNDEECEFFRSLLNN